MTTEGARRPPVDLSGLTAIRGLAAWWVVLYHTRMTAAGWLPSGVQDFFAKGYLAVDLFFILSGFVIQLNYAERLRGGQMGNADFLVRRVARIYPLHILITLAMVAWAGLLLVTGRPLSATYDFSVLWMHGLMIHNWGLTSHLTWNDPSWSISTEWAAYLFFLVLAPMARWPQRSTWLLAGALGGLLLLLHSVFAAAGHAGLGGDIASFGLLRCIAQFTVGTILCELWRRAVAANLRWHWPGLAFVTLVAAGIGLGLPDTAFVPLACTFLILAVALAPQTSANPLVARPLVYLGDISYSTYLVHFAAFIAWKLAMVPEAGHVAEWQLPAFLMFVLLLSVLLYHGVERPIQRLIQTRWIQYRTRNVRRGAGATQERG